jgi:hypothetical protein
MTMAAATMTNYSEKLFQAEDYSRFLIWEFLKKNGFEKTYNQFISEDTKEKVTMTKS